MSYPQGNFNTDFSRARMPQSFRSRRAVERLEEIETIARVTESQCRTWQWLKNFTALRVGGPIAAILYPSSITGAAQVVHRLQQAGIPWRALGYGASVLASDEVHDFVAISLRLLDERLVFEKDRVQVHAGYSLLALVKATAERSLSGLESFAGLTGSVGGALCMGTEVEECDLWHLVESVSVAERGEAKPIPTRDLAYREIVYREGARSLVEDKLILSVTLKLAAGDTAAIRDETEKWELARWKAAPEPGTNASRVFDDVLTGTDAAEPRPTKSITARELVDDPGFKGKGKGAARVSAANTEYIVNEGEATVDEVLSLSALIREQARKLRGLNLKFGVDVWKNESGNESDRK